MEGKSSYDTLKILLNFLVGIRLHPINYLICELVLRGFLIGLVLIKMCKYK